MRKDKITQKKAVFYVLWKAHKETPEKFIPAWHFVGELFLKEVNQWFMMSYKCPANGVEIYFDNPGLIERRLTTGKTGAKYFEYRMNQNATFNLIVDPDIKAFAQTIERRYRENNHDTMESKQSGRGVLEVHS